MPFKKIKGREGGRQRKRTKKIKIYVCVFKVFCLGLAERRKEKNIYIRTGIAVARRPHWPPDGALWQSLVRLPLQGGGGVILAGSHSWPQRDDSRETGARVLSTVLD